VKRSEYSGESPRHSTISMRVRTFIHCRTTMMNIDFIVWVKKN
jgi:hypothetical protein